MAKNLTVKIGELWQNPKTGEVYAVYHDEETASKFEALHLSHDRVSHGAYDNAYVIGQIDTGDDN